VTPVSQALALIFILNYYAETEFSVQSNG